MSRINPLIAATLTAVLILGLGLGASAADAAVISRQAVKQRSIVETWKRCRDDEVASRSMWECHETRPGRPRTRNVQAWNCVFRSLSFRKASCDVEYVLVSGLHPSHQMHCYGRATWRGEGNNIRLVGRFRIDCVSAAQSRLSRSSWGKVLELT